MKIWKLFAALEVIVAFFSYEFWGKLTLRKRLCVYLIQLGFAIVFRYGNKILLVKEP
jgi:hypothetical protein